MIAQRLGVQRHVDRVEAEFHEGVAHHGLPGRLLSEQRRRLDELHEQLLHRRPAPRRSRPRSPSSVGFTRAARPAPGCGRRSRPA